VVAQATSFGRCRAPVGGIRELLGKTQEQMAGHFPDGPERRGERSLKAPLRLAHEYAWVSGNKISFKMLIHIRISSPNYMEDITMRWFIDQSPIRAVAITPSRRTPSRRSRES
jgi:hypothetical protein